jgi:glycosyltransferase involved in cell wall biosynthesis
VRHPDFKIGFSLAHASPIAGGISEVVKGLGQAIAAKGAKIRVFAGEDKHLAAGTERWEQLDATVSKIRGPRKFGYQVGLREAVKAWAPASMHIHGLWMYPSWATRHWRQQGIPYVVAPHGMLEAWALSQSAGKKRVALAAFERASLEHAACVHALSESELHSIRAFGLTNPVAVIPNGVNTPERRSTGATGRKVMLFLGRIHPKKGLKELTQAWKVAKSSVASGRDWRLVIAGWDDGGHLTDLRRLREELGLEDEVEFIGPVFGEEKARTLLGADAFILPSKSEGLPMSVLEAWSYALPVLMTKECNLVTAFHQNAAIQISSDANGLAGQLRRFFELSDGERATVAENGLHLVEQVYRWPAIAERVIALHHWVAGEGRKPDFVEVIR